MSNETIAIVMAAGQGTRMQSDLPKVLFPVCGKPMIEYVLDALAAAEIRRILVVVGYRSDLVRETLAHYAHLEFVEQSERLGTGHAVMMCRAQLESSPQSEVFVLAGDCPMIQVDSLEKMLLAYQLEEESSHGGASCVLGTAYKANPVGLGRIVRDEHGEFARIVEERDATDAEKKITEVNMSYYLFHACDLLEALTHLRTNNAQKEYYITDAPAVLTQLSRRVLALPALKPIESLGINTLEELHAVEEALDPNRVR